MALGVVQHLEQHPELDAVGVRLDLTWRRGQFMNSPGIFLGLSVRGEVDELYVRIGDGGLLDILVHGGPPLLVSALDFEGHLGSPVVLPVDLLFLKNPRLVPLCIDLDLEVMGGRSRAGAGDYLYGFARCQLPIHACS